MFTGPRLSFGSRLPDPLAKDESLPGPGAYEVPQLIGNEGPKVTIQRMARHMPVPCCAVPRPALPCPALPCPDSFMC
jgi:hypothetical protein